VDTSDDGAIGRPGQPKEYSVYGLSDEDLAIQSRARTFAGELIPFEVTAEMEAGELPPDVTAGHAKRARELGLYATNMPRELGGGGCSMLQVALVQEQMGRVTNALGWVAATPPSWLPPIATPYQIEQFIRPAVAGEREECYAITEEGAGSDVAGLQATARRVPGDGAKGDGDGNDEEGMGRRAGGGELTIVLSSHLIADIERVCDHLILLADARVQLCGDIDTLLAGHRVLVGPRKDTTAIARAHTIVREDSTERQTTLLVRLNGPVLDPAWAVEETNLEEMVLGYMTQGAAGPGTGPAAGRLSAVGGDR
jgi:hypothetical protein